MKRPYESAGKDVGESQLIQPVEEEYKIPSETEHKKLLVRLWIACIATSAGVFLIFGGIVLTLFLKGVDDKKIINVSTAVFQVLSMTAGVGFFIPLGLTSIVTLLLGIRMNRKSVAVLDKLDGAVESRLNRIDSLFSKLEGFVLGLEKGEVPPAIQHYIDDGKAFVTKELAGLRNDIRGARAGAEGELADALAQGELEAAELAKGEQDLEAGKTGG